MEFITGKHISRRSFVRGMGATVALPFLDAMVPAGRPWRDLTAAPGYTRLVCIEESMGSAGGSTWGDAQHLFAPAKTGRDFDFLPTSQLAPLQEYRDYLTIAVILTVAWQSHIEQKRSEEIMTGQQRYS